ncbi:MAG TPA: nicotinate-nucleotide adenylyltransferase [Syntrophorhabdaceae bacterium]|nr:nicotinate-nucleotide adenylyltransferase [Syntrophorhabdaceae bacterium]
MKIGIFGGTFDPVHIGHLRVAEEIREAFSLERIVFVPVFVPPHKRNCRITGADDRLHMLKAGTRGNRFFRTSEIEIQRGGISYTLDTLKVFEKRFGEVYFLIGIDAFSDIHTWHAYRELFSHAHFIVMTRPAHTQPPLFDVLPDDVRGEVKALDEATLEHASGRRIYLHEITQLDISSTKIKKLLKSGRSVRYLVPGSVERYIHQRRLYRA